MRLLLDSHAFLWFILGDQRLSDRAQSAIAAADADVLISPATLWEMTIKVRLGKYTLPGPFGPFMDTQLTSNRIRLLPIEVRHTALLASMPFHHRDKRTTDRRHDPGDGDPTQGQVGYPRERRRHDRAEGQPRSYGPRAEEPISRTITAAVVVGEGGVEADDQIGFRPGPCDERCDRGIVGAEQTLLQHERAPAHSEGRDRGVGRVAGTGEIDADDVHRRRPWGKRKTVLAKNSAYGALKTTLKAEINAEAWESLNSDTSPPFPKPKSRRIAVQVINHLRDEVMKVFRV